MPHVALCGAILPLPAPTDLSQPVGPACHIPMLMESRADVLEGVSPLCASPAPGVHLPMRILAERFYRIERAT